MEWLRLDPALARVKSIRAFSTARWLTMRCVGKQSCLAAAVTWVILGFGTASNWTQKFPAHSPSARYGHAMAYDAARGQTILFGGFDVFQNLSDTWVWDGQDWTQMSPSSSPPANTGYVITFDSGLEKVVFQGGYQSPGWVWDGTNWAVISSIGPPTRAMRPSPTIPPGTRSPCRRHQCFLL